jgi:hypothetical protein
MKIYTVEPGIQTVDVQSKQQTLPDNNEFSDRLP